MQNTNVEMSTNDYDEFTQWEPRGTVSATGIAQTEKPPDAMQLYFNMQVKSTVKLAMSIVCRM